MATNGGEPSLQEAIQQTLDEARMVLPGIQALFGFQLIAVFNDGFAKSLTPTERVLHLAALVLTVTAAALLMTPAAYHRQAHPREADRHFLDVASNCITGALLPLAIGLSLDVHLVARIVLDDTRLAAGIAVAVLGLLLGLWFVYPRRERMKGRNG